MVTSLGDLVETTIYFSVFFFFYSLSKCPTLFSFFSFLRPKKQSTQQCCIFAVRDVTESVRRDCRSGAQSHIKNHHPLTSLLLLSQRLNRSCAPYLKAVKYSIHKHLNNDTECIHITCLSTLQHKITGGTTASGCPAFLFFSLKLLGSN